MFNSFIRIAALLGRQSSGPTDPFTEIVPVTYIDGDSSLEATWESGLVADQANLVFEALPSDSTVTFRVEVRTGVGGSAAWQTTGYDCHISISRDDALGYLGDAAGNEICATVASNCCVQEVLTLTGMKSGQRPLIGVKGGMRDNATTPRISHLEGEVVFTSNTDEITGIRIVPSAGTITQGAWGAWWGPFGEFLPLDEGTEINISNDASVSVTLPDNPLSCASIGEMTTSDNSARAQARVATGVIPIISDYHYHSRVTNSGAGTYAGIAGSSATAIDLTSLSANTAGHVNINSVIPKTSSKLTPIAFSGGVARNSAATLSGRGIGLYDGTTNALTGMQFLASAGNLLTGKALIRQLAYFSVGDIGQSLGPWTLEDVQEASSDADIQMDLNPALRYALIAVGVVPSVDNAPLYARLTVNEVEQTSNNYGSHYQLQSPSSTSYASNAFQNGVAFVAAAGIGSGSGRNALVQLTIPNTPSYSSYRNIFLENAYINSSGGLEGLRGAAAYRGQTGPVTKVKLYMSSGNVDEGLFLLFRLGPVMAIEYDQPTINITPA